MSKPITLGAAAYKAGLLASLFAVMMEKSGEEKCSPELQDLIAIAADLNQEINHSLSAEVAK